MRKKQLRYVILAVIAGSTMLAPVMANDSVVADSKYDSAILVNGEENSVVTVDVKDEVYGTADEVLVKHNDKVYPQRNSQHSNDKMSVNLAPSSVSWGDDRGVVIGNNGIENKYNRYVALDKGIIDTAYVVNYLSNGGEAKYNVLEMFSGDIKDEVAGVKGANNADSNLVVLHDVGTVHAAAGAVSNEENSNATKNVVFVTGGEDIQNLGGAVSITRGEGTGSLTGNLVVLGAGKVRSASGAVALSDDDNSSKKKSKEVIGNRVLLGVDSADTKNGKISHFGNIMDSKELKKRMGKNISNPVVSPQVAQIMGGFSETNKANNNIVIIGEGLIGGKSMFTLKHAQANPYVNGIDVSGLNSPDQVMNEPQEHDYFIIGGVSDVEATGNIVDVNNAKALASGKVGIWGGHYFSSNATGDIKTGNTLNLNRVKGITLSHLANFENYNFDLPKDVVNGDTILTVTDPNGTDVSKTKINVGVSGEAPVLHKDDAIKLIYNKNGVTTTGAQYGKLQQGASLAYDITAKAGDDAKSVIAVIKENSTENTPNPTQPTTGGSVNPATPSTGDTAGTTPANGGTAGTTPTNDGTTGTTPANGGTVGTTPANGGTTGTPAAAGTTTPSTGTIAGSVLPQTKSFVETRTAVSSVINNSQDSIVKAFANTSSTAPIVAGVSHGRMRVESGSYANINGTNIVLGLGKQAGKTYWGPFVEMGWARYDSHLDSGLRADGNAKYYGVGVYGKTTYDNGIYLEGSIRGGRTSYNYKSNEIKTATKAVHTSYDAHNMYYAAHVGLGKVVSYGNGYEGTVYGNLFYSHQGEATATLKGEGLGETYTFAGVNSLRTRLGYKVSKQLGNSYTGYAGAAYEHEFSGEAHATVKGASTLAPSLGGSSGLVEVGVTYGSTADTFTGTLNVEGWFGQKRGTTIGGRVNWKY